MHQVHGDDAVPVAAGEARDPLPPALVVERHDVGVDAAPGHGGAEGGQVRRRVGPGGGGGIVGAAVGGEVPPALKYRIISVNVIYG